MSARRLYFTPSGRAITVVTCRKRIYVQALRKETDRWTERLRTFDGYWIVAVYADDDLSLWLHSALAGMLGSPGTGGLISNLKRARDASVVYEVQWQGTGLKVALCDQDPAFEGGISNLIEKEAQFQRGEIAIPPSIVRVREMDPAFRDIDAIMLPASPKESNAMRLSLARTLLIRPQALATVEPERPVSLGSPYPALWQTLRHRAPDRTASLEDPPGPKLWAAPRLAYFLARRRIAQVKDWLRRVFVERPATSLASIGEFLADLPRESLGDLLRAIGFLTRSLLEGWAALLLAFAALISALSQAGLL